MRNIFEYLRSSDDYAEGLQFLVVTDRVSFTKLLMTSHEMLLLMVIEQITGYLPKSTELP